MIYPFQWDNSLIFVCSLQARWFTLHISITIRCIEFIKSVGSTHFQSPYPFIFTFCNHLQNLHSNANNNSNNINRWHSYSCQQYALPHEIYRIFQFCGWKYKPAFRLWCCCCSYWRRILTKFFENKSSWTVMVERKIPISSHWTIAMKHINSPAFSC